MPGYSHRDLRAFRTAHRRIAVVTVGTGVLVLGAWLLPPPALAFAALLGLAALGGVALRSAEVEVAGYIDDVRSVRAGRAVPGALRAEVHSTVSLHPTSWAAASPHSRRARANPPDAGLPAWSVTGRMN